MKHTSSEKRWNKAGRVFAGALTVVMLLVGCGANEVKGSTAQEEMSEMKMKINETEVAVDWEENGSVEALKELCLDTPLTVRMSMYGGFEQVGSLGTSLPRNDVQTTTSAGDIVLYSGSQMVVFYGSNSWAYTRLGRITDKSPQELAELLGRGDVTVTIDTIK